MHSTYNSYFIVIKSFKLHNDPKLPAEHVLKINVTLVIKIHHNNYEDHILYIFLKTNLI